MAMSMLIRTMMMATWYSANNNIPTPSTTDVAWFPPGKLYAYSLFLSLLASSQSTYLQHRSFHVSVMFLSLLGYLISTLSTLTSPNIDQNRLKSVLGNLSDRTRHIVRTNTAVYLHVN